VGSSLGDICCSLDTATTVFIRLPASATAINIHLRSGDQLLAQLRKDAIRVQAVALLPPFLLFHFLLWPRFNFGIAGRHRRASMKDS